jgi:hypothetical protein
MLHDQFPSCDRKVNIDYRHPVPPVLFLYIQMGRGARPLQGYSTERFASLTVDAGAAATGQLLDLGKGGHGGVAGGGHGEGAVGGTELDGLLRVA